MPHRTRIKICGITRPEDAALVAEEGADAIGMVLHAGSKRNVDVRRAGLIRAAVPPFVTPVAVFVDAPASEIIRIARLLGVSHLQLNGPYTQDAIDELVRSSLSVSVAVPVAADMPDAIEKLRGVTIVLETARSGIPGGSGVANDWELVRHHQALGTFRSVRHLVAAGGLTPPTVGEVIRTIRPWAVDVSSGVESEIGVKSPRLVREFVAAVSAADASITSA